MFHKKFPAFKSLDSPHLNKIIDIYDDNNYFYFTSEYIKGGELFTHLGKR